MFDISFIFVGNLSVLCVLLHETGIDSSDLEVLETHVTFSLSKEKSAARFYMMQCPGSVNVNEQVPLKFIVERLVLFVLFHLAICLLVLAGSDSGTTYSWKFIDLLISNCYFISKRMTCVFP